MLEYAVLFQKGLGLDAFLEQSGARDQSQRALLPLQWAADNCYQHGSIKDSLGSLNTFQEAQQPLPILSFCRTALTKYKFIVKAQTALYTLYTDQSSRMPDSENISFLSAFLLIKNKYFLNSYAQFENLLIRYLTPVAYNICHTKADSLTCLTGPRQHQKDSIQCNASSLSCSGLSC